MESRQPTSYEAWTALADRIEKSIGPDRGIDEAIELLICTSLGLKDLSRSQYGGWFSQKHGLIGQPQRYTDSIDAIVGLIELEFPHYGHGYVKSGGFSIGTIYIPGEIDLPITDARGWGRKIDGTGNTPALALCAAFCKAMAGNEMPA